MAISRRIVPRARRPYDTFCRETRTKFYEALLKRMPINRACELAGFNIGTYYQWMERGKDPLNREHYFFRERVLRIRAKKETAALEVIEKAANELKKITETTVKLSTKGKEITKKTRDILPDWQAAAWWLSRSFPKEYGGNMPIEQEERTPQDIANEIRRALISIGESIPNE